MQWFIDGYNVIGSEAGLRTTATRTLDDRRARLLGLIAQAAGASGDRFTVVFDGARREAAGPTGGQVEVLFSRPPESADDVLIRLAREWRDGAIVVSSDRAVRDAAQRAGAVALGARQFLDRLESLDQPAGEADDADDAEDDDEEEAGDDRQRKRGNPRRLSREARAAARALRRLGRS